MKFFFLFFVLYYGIPISNAFLGNHIQRSQHARAAFCTRISATAIDTSTMIEEDTVERIISMTPKALDHLVSLQKTKGSDSIILRMGVKSGGCSGMSYVMDLVSSAEITEDDLIEDYPEHGFKCAIDPKSMLYLYGLQLDYSDALIGGGFQFQNPNAESSCGCGKSFGV